MKKIYEHAEEVSGINITLASYYRISMYIYINDNRTAAQCRSSDDEIGCATNGKS